MDSELVSGQLSDNTSVDYRGGGSASALSSNHTEIFLQQFPYYLSIGMTEKQYWDGDAALAKYYREAENLRMERRNKEAWLQGMYIYDAIQRLSPALRAFPKKGTKPKPYPEEPYPITQRSQIDKEQRKEKEISDKGLAKMEAFMTKFNKKFKEGK